MQVDVRKSGQALVVRVSGEFDESGVDAFRQAVDAALADLGSRLVLFDLSEVSFIDSSGVGAVLGRFKRLQEKGGRAAAAVSNPRVRMVLELAGVGRLMPLAESRTRAMEHLKGGTGR